MTEPILPIEESETGKAKNIRGDVVDVGEHQCDICKKWWRHEGMIWTDGKIHLCLSCYYDL